MIAFEFFLIPLIFLLGALFLTMTGKALRSLGRLQVKKEFNRHPHLYFVYLLIKKLFRDEEWDNFFFLSSCSKQILRLLYATTSLFYFLNQFLFHSPHEEGFFFTISYVILVIAIITLIAILLDFCMRLLAPLRPRFFLRISIPLTTFFILIFSPITFLLLIMQKKLFSKKQKGSQKTHPSTVKEKILELVYESELKNYLAPFDQKLISSIAAFRDRIVREIMVPRVHIFSLSSNQTIHEAAQKFMSENYSRVPIYNKNIDQIEGVLLYKDVLNFYIKYLEKTGPSPLETSLSTLMTPILFTPETKKISQLLQDFLTKKIHLAIVVDEYGGTEGVITIEDILEELVGEIEDEYDIDEKLPYTPLPEGGWIVDSGMNILDLQKELKIQIPASPEYDTIGGYIFHRAGTIPSNGWRIHHDNFDLEVISTTERSIDKIKIILPPF